MTHPDRNPPQQPTPQINWVITSSVEEIEWNAKVKAWKTEVSAAKREARKLKIKVTPSRKKENRWAVKKARRWRKPANILRKKANGWNARVRKKNDAVNEER